MNFVSKFFNTVCPYLNFMLISKQLAHTARKKKKRKTVPQLTLHSQAAYTFLYFTKLNDF